MLRRTHRHPNTAPTQTVKQYALTASAGEGGSVSPTTGSFNSGTQVSVTQHQTQDIV